MEDGQFPKATSSSMTPKPSDYSNFFPGNPMSMPPMAGDATTMYQAKEWEVQSENMNPSSSSSHDHRNISYISLLNQQYPQTIFHQNSLVNSAEDDATLQQSYQLPNSQFQ